MAGAMKEPAFTSNSLEELQQQIAEWRHQQTGGRRRLPEAFWEAASWVAKTHGAGLVGRALRIDYYKLRDRVSRLSSVPKRPVVKPSGAVPGFLELRMETPPACGSSVGLLELVDGTGRRLRLETGRDPSAWVALVESFLKAQP